MSPERSCGALAERGGFTPFQSKKDPIAVGGVKLMRASSGRRAPKGIRRPRVRPIPRLQRVVELVSHIPGRENTVVVSNQRGTL